MRGLTYRKRVVKLGDTPISREDVLVAWWTQMTEELRGKTTQQTRKAVSTLEVTALPASLNEGRTVAECGELRGLLLSNVVVPQVKTALLLEQ